MVQVNIMASILRSIWVFFPFILVVLAFLLNILNVIGNTSNRLLPIRKTYYHDVRALLLPLELKRIDYRPRRKGSIRAMELVLERKPKRKIKGP